jgi:hypothetical protein
MKASLSKSSLTGRLLPVTLAVLAVVVIAPAAVLSATSAKKPAAGVTTPARTTPAKTTPAKTTPAPASGTLSLAVSRSQIVYGTATVLSGVVSNLKAGESVTVLSKRYDAPKPTSLATVTTTTGGAWSYSVKPAILTSYGATWKNAASPSLSVAVRPLGTFHLLTTNRFSTRLVAARSFAGKFVQLQRRSPTGQWVTLKRMQLNATSASIFRPTLPAGTSTLRIAMSVNQAGPGYLAGISRTIVYDRP